MATEAMMSRVEAYLLDRPMALAVASRLAEVEEGMTATDLALEFHVSVPTMYRLTSEMWKLQLLVANRAGRKVEYTLQNEVKASLPKMADKIKPILARTTSVESKLVGVGELMKEYQLPLGPQYAQFLVKALVRKYVNEALPKGIRQRRVGVIRSGLGEPVRFDLFFGNDNEFVAVDLKIVETNRHLRERLGIMASMVGATELGLKGVVLAYLLTPLGEQWFVDEQAALETFRSLKPKGLTFEPVIVKVGQADLVDSKFLSSFARQLTAAVTKVMKT
jgi:hypothetical protein